MPDTMMTKREAIMAALAERLSMIQPAYGYDFDLLGHIYEWDTTPHDPNLEQYRVEYRDGTETLELLSVGTQLHRLSVDLRIICTTTTPLADIRKLIGAVTDVIGQDPTLGGVALDIDQNAVWRADKAQAGDTAAGASVSYEVQFTTEPWDPYNS